MDWSLLLQFFTVSWAQGNSNMGNKTCSLSSSSGFYSRFIVSVSTSCNFSGNHPLWPLKRYFQSFCLDNSPELELFIFCLCKRYHRTHHNDTKQVAIRRLIDNQGLYQYRLWNKRHPHACALNYFLKALMVARDHMLVSICKINVYTWLYSSDPSSDLCWQFCDTLSVTGSRRFFQCK